MTTSEKTGLALLRVDFPDHQISKLPKQMKREDQDKGKCERGSKYCADNSPCGGWHARSIHLDYVGHAALTDRLLDADPSWTWEPLAFGEDGLPKLDNQGGLWIRLTVCDVTRLGYGDAQGKTGPNAIKEAIGDALRNAAMRFGAALDLWHKGDLHADEEATPAPTVQSVPDLPVDESGMNPGQLRRVIGQWAKEHDVAVPQEVERRFAAFDDTPGLTIASASSKTLLAFLGSLRASEAA